MENPLLSPFSDEVLDSWFEHSTGLVSDENKL
ncbi:hypothetical protein ABID23_000766 [Bartonella silvatica]|uniref:Uncharacterized protein n=1 Tax=Bartonella silvatica TaxID=357760 RepID=A0ABV2HGK3_9HYPH